MSIDFDIETDITDGGQYKDHTVTGVQIAALCTTAMRSVGTQARGKINRNASVPRVQGQQGGE